MAARPKPNRRFAKPIVLADGTQSKLPSFTIRSLKVGDKVIENVVATVVPLEGQLLLGQ